MHAACLKLAKNDSETRQQMDAMDQIGDTVIDSLAAYFSEHHNVDIVEQLTKQVRIRDAEKPTAHSPIAGKTIVFTGSMEQLTREEAKSLAERLGATLSGTVSTMTDFVVAGANAGSKLKRANELGVEVLDEAKFIALVKS